jgi:hypothetical protein
LKRADLQQNKSVKLRLVPQTGNAKIYCKRRPRGGASFAAMEAEALNSLKMQRVVWGWPKRSKGSGPTADIRVLIQQMQNRKYESGKSLPRSVGRSTVVGQGVWRGVRRRSF